MSIQWFAKAMCTIFKVFKVFYGNVLIAGLVGFDVVLKTPDKLVRDVF